MANPTLANVAKFVNVSTELIDEAAVACPEFTVLPWKTVPGYVYNTLVKTADPTVTFRDANDGTTSYGNTYTNRVITCAILEPNFICDKAVADSCVEGVDYYLAKETAGQLSAAILTATKQFYYGTGNDAKGFVGLDTNVADAMVVNAGGDSSAATSSVYVFACNQPDYATWVLGGNGAFEIGEPRIQKMAGSVSGFYSAYVMDSTIWVGQQIGHQYAVARIANLDVDHTLDDDLVFDAFAKFPSGLVPTHIFMSRANQNILRKSRTATNMTGAPAPTPMEVGGVPIYVTGALVATEAVWSAGSGS